MSLSTVFFQSYHDGQLSLLPSTSRLRVLPEQCVLSSVTKISGRERIIFMKVFNLIKIKAHIPSIAVHTFKSHILSIRLTTSQGAK